MVSHTESPQINSLNDSDERESPHQLLKFLTELSRALTTAGIAVMSIESILKKICQAYGFKAEEVISLPTFLIIKIADDDSKALEVTLQKPGVLPLDQVSKLYELINQAVNAEITPEQGIRRINEIINVKRQHNYIKNILGYALFSTGLGMLFLPTFKGLFFCGALGAIAGLILAYSEDKTKLTLVLPVLTAFTVSTVFFLGVKQGIINGSLTIMVPALAYFIPGAVLSTGMFELAANNLVSGAARLVQGVVILLLLLFGVIVGLQVAGLPEDYIIANTATPLYWWAPYIGVLIFALGMYLLMCIRNKDMLGVLIVLFTTFLVQQAGNYLLGGLFGAFIGSVIMTMLGTFLERSKLRTPYYVSIIPAFWILVPGALGFISLAALVGQNYSSSIASLIQVVLTFVAISTGLLIGAVIADPLKIGSSP
ncbi:threonine/serine ThrE exporter family protein [Methanosarcina sp.]|uniref:threonine/serine ThrE exporter family protein n=1 Tax=Methanosarcina sp. TaxID=2213 RepID=UPI002988A9AA|nr:threonine/serine exporter family protein [Methanosarcina sp.]MDW5550409.1 threonine/serine exporter family protein [Methanosarcina sp.]MDW5554733.1 threonine/serine exporter family protein [Methanosarcina sp.]MDW5559968.1 threonine/serine exporter family protein [Methanosarcina sp.]